MVWFAGDTLKDSFQWTIFSSTSSFILTAYYVIDWAACADSRRSLTYYFVFLVSPLISWKTKKQPTFSHSSSDAEHRSMAFTACKLQWIYYIIHDFKIEILYLTLVW